MSDMERMKEEDMKQVGESPRDHDMSVTASTRCTPSPFERDFSRASTPLRTQSALDTHGTYSRGSPLPRVADQREGLAVNLDEFSDFAILGALLALPRNDQGHILASWAHRLERTNSCHILERQITRRCAKNAQVIVREATTQTDIVGSRDLGDTLTHTLREGIQQLKHHMDGAREALSRTTEKTSLVRSGVREVHVAVFQTAGQAEIAAQLTSKLVGHVYRTERRFSRTATITGDMELPPALQECENDPCYHAMPQGVESTQAESSDEEHEGPEDGMSRAGSKESQLAW